MFYETAGNNHGLEFNPFKALVAPRPIGWISSIDRDGVVNLAPYSYFNAISDVPPYVMFSSGGRKDSMRNVEETGEFVCSFVTYELKDQMNATSARVGPEIDEFEFGRQGTRVEAADRRVGIPVDRIDLVVIGPAAE